MDFNQSKIGQILSQNSLLRKKIGPYYVYSSQNKIKIRKKSIGIALKNADHRAKA